MRLSATLSLRRERLIFAGAVALASLFAGSALAQDNVAQGLGCVRVRHLGQSIEGVGLFERS